MYCKYCGSKLEDGSELCPSCGKDNALAQQGVEIQPEKPKMGAGKLALIIGTCVVLVAVLAALIAGGMNNETTETTGATGTTTASTEQTVGTTEATIPADGNPDDVTCKGSYTVTDDEVVAAMDTVVATMGEYQLTNRQLQIYYWMQVQDFLSNYSYYANYFGLDYTQPLDTQSCYFAEGQTWQQYFLASALNSWQNYQSLANKAAAEGFALSAEYENYLNTLADTLETNAVEQGFENAQALLAYNVGAGATVEDYVEFTRVYYEGYMYYENWYNSLAPTDEEIEAYFDLYAEDYEASGITKDIQTVNVRHILILPEGATSETIYTETFSDDAWAAGKQKAEDILNEWLAGEKTENSFAELANTYSQDPGSNTNGGLYTEVYEGDMVETFDAWCFDENRQVGDYGIVETPLGYHVMYFSGTGYPWYANAKNDLIGEMAGEMINEISSQNTVEVDYNAIVLGLVDLGA